MKYTMSGKHISVEIDDDGVRFVDPRSNLGRRILGVHGGGLTLLTTSTVDEIRESVALISTVCEVFADFDKEKISVHHAIGVIGNALELFDNSVPEPEKPTTFVR